METVIGTILSAPPKEGQGSQWALTVAVLLLAFAIAWLIRKLDKNAKADAKRSGEFRQALEAHQNETDQRFIECKERMASIERIYLPRETHYKDVGGWRTDLNDLRSNISDELRGVRQEMSALIPSIIKIAMKNGGPINVHKE